MSVCASCVCSQKGNTTSRDSLCLCVFLCLCLFVGVCLSVFICLCLYLFVFPVCAVEKEIQEAVMVFACVCLSAFVCLCLFACVYLSVFVCLYVFHVCAVEKEIQEAVMPSRHIGQLAVSLSSQTANARFSSSLLKKKIKIQILFLPTREKINTKYKLFLLPPQYSLFPANSSRPKFSFKILTKFQP